MRWYLCSGLHACKSIEALAVFRTCFGFVVISKMVGYSVAASAGSYSVLGGQPLGKCEANIACGGPKQPCCR